MSYPNILTEVKKGLSLYMPEPLKVKEYYEQMCLTDSKTPFPFWVKIWSSAKAMLEFLDQEPDWIKSKNVLEIGAGIGMPSFGIANKVSKMIISDHSADAIKLIQKNIDYLQLKNAQAFQLDWNDFPIDLKADTILMSDTNYDPTQIQPLLKMINHFLNINTTIIIATPERITATPFVSALEPFIKHSSKYNIEEVGKNIEIRMLVLSE